MAEISKVLFWLANSLLIPDILILIILFIRSLMLLGSFYNQFTIRLKNKKNIDSLLWRIEAEGIHVLRENIPEKSNSAYIKYLKKLLDREPDDAYSEFVLSNFENEADKDLSTSRLLAKLGPVLGLIGTLIAMSPALVGLSTGDISGMAYNMQVVFATTVVGLIISVVGLVTLQFKKRWYLQETGNLEYVAQVLTKNQRS
ncbi:MAG: MotA/TolQ/ExbB proton channel family protein [Chitinophagaceae bacterium]|nr:MotA/TolQ/ExbB proton channel family protein [Chitinophagaceae bacterium]